MVSDSKTSDGDVKWSSQKIERIGDTLIGCAGDCVDIEKFIKWRRGKGRKPKLTNEFSGLQLDAEGVWLWDKKLEPFPAGREYHAIGTGAKAALAAFSLGAAAIKAVEVACEIDDGSEGPIQMLKLEE